MIRIKRTDSKDEDFITLVEMLDAELADRDGKEHSFYHQFNGIDQLKYVLLVYNNDQAIGCGAIKEFDSDTIEVKRMYVIRDMRQKGLAIRILKELEDWACELGYHRCVLETGKRQAEAINLYTKAGYQIIENYYQYKGMANSVCFEKTLENLHI